MTLDVKQVERLRELADSVNVMRDRGFAGTLKVAELVGGLKALAADWLRLQAENSRLLDAVQANDDYLRLVLSAHVDTDQVLGAVLDANASVLSVGLIEEKK